ncbi:acyltransferase family protein [Nocardioides sp. SR21]|uniref:acyltransferase family protein n=1 Tax=Nocardioides sp. SR21 TaxID=2919501 RepID=UPI001FAA44C6|nr:acyltransferase family protein [Nocardioides sp. SR21]
MTATLETLDRPQPSAPREEKPARTRGNSRIRGDIEGLRAVATFLVLPYHAGLMLFPGGFVGVDVFFVISGFVITGQLLKESDRDGTVSLLGFYARRAKRLLPASALVLVATAIMTFLWVPRISWKVVGGDIVSSALYVVNFRLADRSVDYLAEDVMPSPVQHYWSLAVEEQFYLLWPILLLLALAVARRTGLRRNAVLVAGLALVAIPSLVWSAHMVVAQPERSYFDTTVRLWEFTIGAFVAIAATRLDRMPRWLGVTLAWTGLAMVLVSARIYDHEMTWPGPAALLPTVGAGLFIAGGVAAASYGPVRLIGNPFMLFIGYLTYSLYLWHWPLLIVAREHYGGISVTTGMIIVTLSIIPAWLTFHLLENPLRNSTLLRDPKAALSVGANATLVGAAAGLTLVVLFANAASPAAGNARGAAVLSSNPASDPVAQVSGAITPNPLEAPEDVPDLYAEGCQVDVNSSEPTSCTYGPDDAHLTVAVVGDSKAAQWVPAFQVLAEENDWRIETYTKSACQFATVETSLDGEVYQTCRDWTDKVLDRLTGDDRPDVVVTAGQRSQGVVGGDDGDLELSGDAMEQAMVDTWSQLEDAGVQVVVLADTPQTFSEVYACVADHPDDLTACTYDRARGVEASGAPTQQAAAEQAGVPFIDLVDYVCPTAQCPPVIGNVLIYRQGSHLTKTYVETLAPRLDEELARAGVDR